MQEHLLGMNLKNVDFVFEDFMKASMEDVEKKFANSYKVVANLPYYITTLIIFKLLEEGEKVSSLTIMVQKEVAERICADFGGKDYGILTVMTWLYGTPKITRIIGRQMFYPEPNVDSALLHIEIDREKFKDIDKKEFLKFIKACFSMRRKTILNNLSSVYDKNKLKAKFLEEVLRKRPEQFSLNEFVELFKSCKEL